MRRATAFAAIMLAASLYSSAALAGSLFANCRFSRDYEGEERSWVGWSPEKVGYRDYDGVDKTSLMIVSTQLSFTVPAGIACGTPLNGEYLWQFVPAMDLNFTMITDHSSEVFPPSFNPRILRFGFRYRWWPGAKERIPPASSVPIYPRGHEQALGLMLSGWSHHSNGQYAPTYFDAAGNPTDELDKAVKANLDNGDFSTNYVSGEVWFRCSRLDENGNRPKEGFFASLEYQFHHDVLFPGGLDDKIRPIWGRNQVLASAVYRSGYQPDPKGDVALPPGNLGGAYWLLGADAWVVLDAEKQPVVSSWPWRGELEAAWFVPKYLGPAGLFLRGDIGRNPLNIRFVENRNEIIFGLMIDTSQTIERLSP